MPRHRATEPHAEIHKEAGEWIVKIFDVDPVTVAVVVTLTATTFAALWLKFDRFRKLVG